MSIMRPVNRQELARLPGIEVLQVRLVPGATLEIMCGGINHKPRVISPKTPATPATEASAWVLRGSRGYVGDIGFELFWMLKPNRHAPLSVVGIVDIPYAAVHYITHDSV